MITLYNNGGKISTYLRHIGDQKENLWYYYKMKKSILLVLLIISLLLCSCVSQNLDYEGFGFFGTFYSFKGNIQRMKENEKVLYLVENAISPLEGEVKTFNQLSNGESLVLSDCLSELIEFAIDFCTNPLTEGKLDFTIYPLVKLWGFNADNTSVQIPPLKEDIQKTLELVGLKGISYNQNTKTLTKLKDGIELDFGAFGKGFALDYIVRCENNRDGLFNLGGTVAIKGKKAKIGIAPPLECDYSYFASFEIVDGNFISTSGSYEKYFEYEGKRYHHILDNGYPVGNGLVSVTVKAKSGVLADSLSTCCFILGEEKSIALLDYYGASAVFVYDDYTVKTYKMDIEIKASEYVLK